MLRQIKASLELTGHPERLGLWAVCRLGELLLEASSGACHLTWGDMAVNNPQSPGMVRFHLKQSKTDQFGQGVAVVLGRMGIICVQLQRCWGTWHGGRRAWPIFPHHVPDATGKFPVHPYHQGSPGIHGFPSTGLRRTRIGAATSAALVRSRIRQSSSCDCGRAPLSCVMAECRRRDWRPCPLPWHRQDRRHLASANSWVVSVTQCCCTSYD